MSSEPQIERATFLPEKIAISGVEQLLEAAGLAYTRVISIWGKDAPGNVGTRTRKLFSKAVCYVAFFDDLLVDEVPGHGATLEDISAILRFTANLHAEDKVLVHCLAGVSRSPAIAFAIACQHSEAGREEEMLRGILQRYPHIAPNPLIVKEADAILARNGAMLEAIDRVFDGVRGAGIRRPLAES